MNSEHQIKPVSDILDLHQEFLNNAIEIVTNGEMLDNQTFYNLFKVIPTMKSGLKNGGNDRKFTAITGLEVLASEYEQIMLTRKEDFKKVIRRKAFNKVENEVYNALVYSYFDYYYALVKAQIAFYKAAAVSITKELEGDVA